MNMSLIAKELRTQDYERYVCCLFESQKHQPSLFALLAFNQELAKTAEAVTEEATGMIRLKWWQEAIEGIIEGKQPRSHPVVKALAALPVERLSALYPLIEARLADITYRKGFPDKAVFELYLEQTAGYLHVQLASVLDEQAAAASAGAILKAGRLYGLIGVLRAMPYHLERGIVRFPHDVLKRFGISPAAIEHGLEKEAFGHFMDYWMQECRALADDVRREMKSLPPSLIKRFHIVALLYAKSIQNAGSNPVLISRKLANLPVKLWWYERRGTANLLL